ncbi:MAG TPA: hypothetical protein VNJ09_10965 [Chthonomonadales bacterium]|nr:hypothetical protein [Chthonomonadales bacterium]
MSRGYLDDLLIRFVGETPVAGEQVRAVVRWRGTPDRSRLRGKHVILHFNIRSAMRCSYRWGDMQEV